ncbi:MAG TPA: YkvA family protein [Blastocatellia bacterium]
MSCEGELKVAQGGPKFVANWRLKADRLLKEARVFYFVSKHPRTSWYIKWVAALSVAYLFSPVQLIPSFIPVIGFLDDFLVLFVAAKVVQRFAPPDLLRECRELADATEIRRKENVRLGIASSSLFLTAVWLLAAVAASALIAAYVYR